MCVSTLLAQVILILFAELDAEMKRDFGSDVKKKSLSTKKFLPAVDSKVKEPTLVEVCRKRKDTLLPRIVAIYAELLTPNAVMKSIRCVDESDVDELELAAVALHSVIMMDIAMFMRRKAGVADIEGISTEGESLVWTNDESLNDLDEGPTKEVTAECDEDSEMVSELGLNDPLFLLLLETITGAKNIITERGRRWQKLARRNVFTDATPESPAEADDDFVVSAFENNVNRVCQLLLSEEQKATVAALVSAAQ